jgi:hypothetical protein
LKPFRALATFATLATAVVSLLLAGVGPTHAASTTRLLLSFDNPSGVLGSAQTSFTSTGTASVRITVASVHGGVVTSQESRAGQGDAVAFPTFNSTRSAPRAVIRVSSSGPSDDLSPGSADFSWGADFEMSAGVTASKSSGSHDNGDNLVQRGLFTETQYKLQLDGDQPSCRLRGSTGSAGAVTVQAPVVVRPGSWYGATCWRSGSTLGVSVVLYDSAGQVSRAWNASRTSSVGFGQVTYSSSSIPLSVGGKLADTGAIATSASDQFNGSVDNVFVTVSN